jgi:hypothetical protein
MVAWGRARGRLRLTRGAAFWRSGSAGPESGTSSGIRRCFQDETPQRLVVLFATGQEGTMATKHHDQIVETATEARQAERGPSVLALLSVSTGLAVLILGVVWFVFFRT